MTQLSQTILDHFQVRKTKKQKQAFIDLLRQHFPELKLQEGGLPKCRNIIIGDVEKAKVVITAHYDTCAQLPFPNFIMPKNPLFSIGYSVVILIPMLVILFLLRTILGIFIQDFQLLYYLTLAIWFGMLVLLIAGPANKHTANDNTSGVISLCELYSVLTPELRDKAAFVFFDHEETGLVGSSLFRSKYKKVMKDKLLINLDCVSDGNYLLLGVSKKARKDYEELIKRCFQPEGKKTYLYEKAEKLYYPSDQMLFPKTIAIAALKKNLFFGYYMDRIHTSRDTVFDKQNIKLLCEGIHRLLKNL